MDDETLDQEPDRSPSIMARAAALRAEGEGDTSHAPGVRQTDTPPADGGDEDPDGLSAQPDAPAGQAADGDGDDDAPADQPDAAAAGADDSADGDAEEQPGDSEEGGEAPRTFSIEIPTANADGSKGPRGTGTLVLEGLPQEYVDTLRHHIKRSQQVGRVEQEIGTLRPKARVADFYTGQPLAAMHVVAQEKPEIAKEFAQSWMRQHWRDAAAFLEDLRGDADERTLDAEAKLTARDVRDTIQSGQQALSQRDQHEQYAETIQALAYRLMEPLNLSDQEREDFEDMFAARLERAHRERRARGLSPYLSETDATALCQKVVAAFARQKPRPKVTAQIPAKGPKTADDFKKQADRAAQLRKVSGGGAVRPTKVGKLKPKNPTGDPLADSIRALRESA